MALILTHPVYPAFSLGDFLPWTKDHRWVAFLLLVSVMCLGLAVGLAIRTDDVPLSPTEERIIGWCGMMLLVCGGFARAEFNVKKVKHDLVNEQQAHVQEIKELPARVVAEINGGVEKAVEKKLHESALPTKPEDLRALIAETVKQLRAEGWKPPEEPKA